MRIASHRIARKLVRWQKRFPSFRPWEEPQTQTSVTPRREAEGPEYHLAAANGLEPIQATEAWRTAGQGQPIHKKSHSGGTGEEVDRKLRRLQSGLRHWVSKEKVPEPEGGTQLVLKYFGPQAAGSWHMGGGGGKGKACLLSGAARSYKAHPIRRGHSFSSQVGTQL